MPHNRFGPVAPAGLALASNLFLGEASPCGGAGLSIDRPRRVRAFKAIVSHEEFMLCSRCSQASTVASAQASRLQVSGFDHEWIRLARLICERCGEILPDEAPNLDPSDKASQLERLGLRSDGDTLLEP